MKRTVHIIGAGVMGRVLAYQLKRQGIDYKIYDAGNSAALNSMPFVSLYGIESGKSSLGDILVEAYQTFVEFYHREKPLGVEEVPHYIFYDDDNEKLTKRFGKAKIFSIKEKTFSGHQLKSYLIEPKIFLSFLCAPEIIEKRFLKQSDLDSLDIGPRFFCTSALSSKIFTKEASSKIVAGAYLQANVNLGEESFIMTSEWGNLLYYQKSRKVCLGATTEVNEHCLPDLKKLDLIKQYYFSCLPQLSQGEFSLCIGHRLKGKKRHPRFEKLAEGEYLLDSFYKNGYSLPFYYLKKALQVLA